MDPNKSHSAPGLSPQRQSFQPGYESPTARLAPLWGHFTRSTPATAANSPRRAALEALDHGSHRSKQEQKARRPATNLQEAKAFPRLRGLMVSSHLGSERIWCRQIGGGLKEALGQCELAGVASHPVRKGSRGQAFVAALLCLLKSWTLGERLGVLSMHTKTPAPAGQSRSLPTL